MPDHSNIGLPVTERESDLRQLVDGVEGVKPDEPAVYYFSNRVFIERAPYPSVEE